MRRGLGYYPDPDDINDLKFAYSAPHGLHLASSADNTHLLHRTLDQGQIGSCVSHAVAQVIYAAHKLLGITDAKLLSMMALHWLCRAAATPGSDVSLTKWDIGTHIRVAFQILARFGFCPAEAFPYSDSKEGELDGRAPFQMQPPSMAFMRSLDQKKGSSYHRIHELGDGRVRAVKAASADGRVIAFGSKVTEAFTDGKLGTGPVGPPTGDIAGGHAMAIVGFDGDRFLVQNSWGEGFQGHDAPPGMFWMDIDWLTSKELRDLWWAKHVPPYAEAA